MKLQPMPKECAVCRQDIQPGQPGYEQGSPLRSKHTDLVDCVRALAEELTRLRAER